jgi:hypothetical protein
MKEMLTKQGRERISKLNNKKYGKENYNNE